MPTNKASSRAPPQGLDRIDVSFRPSSEWHKRKSSPARYSVVSEPSERLLRPPPLSPPPTPHVSRPRHDSLLQRLRSNSGLALHTNNSLLRQYTEYNQDGSPRLSHCEPDQWRTERLNSLDAMTLRDYRNSISLQSLGGFASIQPALPIPDFFGRNVVQMVLSDPLTSRQLCEFTKRRGGRENIEFLQKVRLLQYDSPSRQKEHIGADPVL